VWCVCGQQIYFSVFLTRHVHLTSWFELTCFLFSSGFFLLIQDIVHWPFVLPTLCCEQLCQFTSLRTESGKISLDMKNYCQLTRGLRSSFPLGWPWCCHHMVTAAKPQPLCVMGHMLGSDIASPIRANFCHSIGPVRLFLEKSDPVSVRLALQRQRDWDRG